MFYRLIAFPLYLFHAFLCLMVSALAENMWRLSSKKLGHPVWATLAAVTMIAALVFAIRFAFRRASRPAQIWLPMLLGLISSICFVLSFKQEWAEGTWWSHGMPMSHQLLNAILLPNGILLAAASLHFKACDEFR